MRKKLEFASDVLEELINNYICEDTAEEFCYCYDYTYPLFANNVDDYIPLISKLFELFTEKEKRELAKRMYFNNVRPDAICEVFKTLGGIDTTDLMNEWKADPRYIEYMKQLNAYNQGNTGDDK